MSALKFAHPTPSLQLQNVQQTQAKLDLWMEQQGLDCILISSQDAFLSEYTALSNNQRFALSGFTGSTGDGIFLSRALAKFLHKKAQFILFVDGRYHLQADQQCSPDTVEVMKLSLDQTIEGALMAWVEACRAPLPSADPSATPQGCLRVGIDGARTTYLRFAALKNMCAQKNNILKVLESPELNAALGLAGWSSDRAIFPLPRAATGRSLEGNLNALQATLRAGQNPETTCMLTCACDDAAWLLNARGYHVPQMSSFMAYTLTIGRNVIVFLPDDSANAPVSIPADVHSDEGHYSLHVVRRELSALQALLSNFTMVEHVAFSDKVMNALLPDFAMKIWPHATLDTQFDSVERLRVAKTSAEKNAIRSAFLKSSGAIAETCRWLKAATSLEKGQPTTDPAFRTPLSEVDLSEKIEREYAAKGAISLSFKSIAAAGANGAVIHYSTPSSETYFQPGDLALLDSGAYYEEGFATDCTRVVFCPGKGKTPEAWQTEIYTLTLKACVAGMTAVFSTSERCVNIDALVRNQVRAKGYEYNHGTGHGIGIHVHESGIRLSTASTYGFTEHAASSIEPGIYLQGKGGVRLENVAFVTRSGDSSELFCFENVVFVGFDWDLIDLNLLTAQEKNYLKQYEARCVALGTHVTPCPLLT